jgi:hypothetical protein
VYWSPECFCHRGPGGRDRPAPLGCAIGWVPLHSVSQLKSGQKRRAQSHPIAAHPPELTHCCRWSGTAWSLGAAQTAALVLCCDGAPIRSLHSSSALRLIWLRSPGRGPRPMNSASLALVADQAAPRSAWYSEVIASGPKPVPARTGGVNVVLSIQSSPWQLVCRCYKENSSFSPLFSELESPGHMRACRASLSPGICWFCATIATGHSSLLFASSSD